jgi:diacylglycerol kinase family enzyme
VQFSINMVGYGLSSAVLATANNLRCCGAAQYNTAARLEVLANPGYRATLVADAGGDADVLRGVWGIIQAQETVHMGAKMAFCPAAKLDDGKLDVTAVLAGGRGVFIRLMGAAGKPTGEHVRDEAHVVTLQARRLSLWPDVGAVLARAGDASGGAGLGTPTLGLARATVSAAAAADAEAAAAAALLGVDAAHWGALGASLWTGKVRAPAGAASVNIDGELTGTAPVTVSVLPGALRVLCPT